jgi:hypothetical protein
MELYMYIKTFIIVLFLSNSLSFSQSNIDKFLTKDTCYNCDNQPEILLAVGYLNSTSVGSVIYYSPQLIYHFTDLYQLKLLFRQGTGTGHFGAVEHRPEYDNELNTYNELSPLFSLSLSRKIMSLYLGTGIGVIWGLNQKNQPYKQLTFPLEAGLSLHIYEKVWGGADYQLNFFSISSPLQGLGINISLKF